MVGLGVGVFKWFGWELCVVLIVLVIVCVNERLLD